MNRVALTHNVYPNEEVTYNFNVTAPSTPGTYNFQWRMVSNTYGWFGATTPNVAVQVGTLDAQLISHSVPAMMTPGQSYAVGVTMQNTGSLSWSAGTINLGSQNPQDNTTWGLSRVPLPSGVAPGQSATFNFNVTAPSTPGIYDFQWRMVDNALGWFGVSTPNVAVVSGVPNAQFVSQSVPAAMVPGQIYAVSVTMQNSGSTTWSAGAYRLGSQNPQDNSTWGLSRVDLPGPVAPGANGTFTFDVTAPAASGPYNFQWRMLLYDTDWIGAPSSNVLVNVGSTQANLFFIHADHLNTPRLVANAAGQTMWLWHQAEPFGNSVPDENPSGLGAFDLPLRMPGQYFDKETNLHYNYFRDYDPSIGRYEESDPIGLKGGLNTYVYVAASPLVRIDPRGLEAATTADALTCILHPLDCTEVRGCRDLAFQATQQEFGRQGHNDAADAFRHCYWSCCMTQRIGIRGAKRHGDAHEQFPSNPQCEKDMDLYNNDIGRGVAQRSPTGDCRVLCKGAPTKKAPAGSCAPCGTYQYYPQ